MSRAVLAFLLAMIFAAVLAIMAIESRSPGPGIQLYMIDNNGDVQAVIDYRRGVVWELGKGYRPATQEEEEFAADRAEGDQR